MLFEHRINRNITLSFNAIYWNNTSIMHLYYKFWFNLFFRCYSVCNLFIYFFSLLEKKILPFFQNHIFFLVFKISNKFDNKIEVTLIENKFNTKKEKVIQNFDNRIILQIFNYSILLQKLKPPHEWSSPIFLFLLITCIIRSCLLFFLLQWMW